MTAKTEKSGVFSLSAQITEYCYGNKMNFSEINKVDIMWIYEAFKK